jgi:hypothetical protein
MNEKEVLEEMLKEFIEELKNLPENDKELQHISAILSTLAPIIAPLTQDEKYRLKIRKILLMLKNILNKYE